MQVKSLDETAIYDIGHAFGYYDDGVEPGLISMFPNREAAAAYICGYVRMTLRGGFLHASSERGEGFTAYQLPGQKIGLRAGAPLMKALFRNMRLGDMLRAGKAMARSGAGLHDQMKRAKQPHIFVGMVCVREKYQGQGYMRQVMDIAFAEGNRLHVPVILETDAQSKCDKYVHLGMQLAGKRSLGAYGALYDLVKEPE